MMCLWGSAVYVCEGTLAWSEQLAEVTYFGLCFLLQFRYFGMGTDKGISAIPLRSHWFLRGLGGAFEMACRFSCLAGKPLWHGIVL